MRPRLAFGLGSKVPWLDRGHCGGAKLRLGPHNHDTHRQEGEEGGESRD